MLEPVPNPGGTPVQQPTELLADLSAGAGLRSIAAEVVAPQAATSSRTFLKFKSFEDAVLEPAARLLASDSLHIAGSYVNNPASLRRASDIDMIVFSSGLKEPASYLSYLNGLEKLATSFRTSTGSLPIFFTQANNETSFTYVARTHSGLPLEEIVPCHFLYYGNGEEMMHREPPGLATKLMRDARSLAGSKPPLPLGEKSAHADLNGLVRWDVERAVAELVLNEHTLPRDFIVPHYVDRLILSMRIFAAHDLSFEGVSMPTLIRSLDPSGAHGLAQQFQAVLEVRQGTSDGKSVAVRDLITPALTILSILDAAAGGSKAVSSSPSAPAPGAAQTATAPDRTAPAEPA